MPPDLDIDALAAEYVRASAEQADRALVAALGAATGARQHLERVSADHCPDHCPAVREAQARVDAAEVNAAEALGEFNFWSDGGGDALTEARDQVLRAEQVKAAMAAGAPPDLVHAIGKGLATWQQPDAAIISAPVAQADGGA